MRVFIHFCIALLSLSLGTGALADKKQSTSTIVDTASGTVKGVGVDGFDVVSWKGLPYANPPTGDLRWKKPADPDSWTGIREASSYGNSCGGSNGDPEDCLFLNVWSPISKGKGEKGKKGKLPVLFYIHGGSNTGGSGEGDWHTTAQEYNAVVVSINYRVGAMGWFSHPALKTGDAIDDSGNYGLLDQVKALQWVQNNIEQFGGDRNNVTIAGASAGAQNVSYLMHTRLAKDLFHKAIMESNYPGIRPVAAATKSSKQVLYNLMVAEAQDNKYYAASHKDAKDMADTMSDAAIRGYFYSKTRDEIRWAYDNWYWGGINWGDFYRDDIIANDDDSPPPIVQGSQNRPEFIYTIGDGYVLPNDIDFADFSAGHGYPKPTVIGTTLNENNAWNATWPFNYEEFTPLEVLVEEAVTSWFWAYSPLTGWNEYPGLFGETPEEFMANYKFGTELIDELDMYLGAQQLARNMVKAKSKVPVYVYRFDWGATEKRNYKIPNEDAWKFYVGAPHVKEFNFFWQRFVGHGPGDSSGYEYNDENLEGRLKLSEAALGYLSEFIHDKKGKIKKKKGLKPEWKAWTEKKEQFMVFDGDYKHAHLKMNKRDIYRTPQQLYDAYMGYPHQQTRDFIAYYVMWSWHYNWYPNGPVDPFDTSPGPNALFDPADP
jgi:para-nitrobenzyl esterase